MLVCSNLLVLSFAPIRSLRLERRELLKFPSMWDKNCLLIVKTYLTICYHGKQSQAIKLMKSL